MALLHHHCGGNVSLDQEPAGHISLTVPGLFNDTDRLDPTNHSTDKTPSFCTWMVDIPPGRTVLLKVVWLESGSNITVQCVGSEEGQVLESEGTALLSNKATLTWTGGGRSSDTIQLSYYGEKLSTQLPTLI